MAAPLPVCTTEEHRAVIRICKEHATSSMITRQFGTTISRDCWILSPVVALDRALLNFSIPSYTLLRGSAPSLYFSRGISALDTPSDQRNQITALCFYLERLCLDCNSGNKDGEIKVKFRSRDHNKPNYRHAWAEGSVTNLNRYNGESVDHLFTYTPI